jgi:hypothetical protein
VRKRINLVFHAVLAILSFSHFSCAQLPSQYNLEDVNGLSFGTAVRNEGSSREKLSEDKMTRSGVSAGWFGPVRISLETVDESPAVTCGKCNSRGSSVLCPEGDIAGQISP